MESKNRASTQANLPSGTVTFLFSDIEGSTKIWEQDPAAMQSSLARHDALLRAAVETNRGWIVKQRGDGIHAVFAVAGDALEAALNAQRALQTESWRTTGPLRVRIVLHTGAVEERDGDYFGSPVNRAARLLACCHGGQILLSLATQELVRDHLSENISLRDLGEHRLKDLIRPERVFQVVAPDLPADFPPLVTLDSRPNNLPAQTTPLVGRDQELAAIEQLLRRGEVRLVTLAGPGGSGKTRLGLQVAANLLDDFQHGVYFINLAPVRDAGLVVSTIAQTLGVRESGGQALIENLKQHLRDKQMLLLLDNFEQVVSAAPLVAELLAASAQLKIIVTSREVLHLRGEHEFPVPPLALPDPKQLPSLKRLSQYAAVALFIQRAVAVKPDFEVTNQNAPAVAEICVRLDGLPLAIELAAARCKILSPQAILQRLEHRLTLLTSGARDLPARHQTLRSAIAWSYDLLDAGEKILFARLGVFVGGCTLEAAEAIGGADAFAGIESLVTKNLLRLEESGTGESRVTMLETIREFARERLEESESAAIRKRHADYYLTWVDAVEPKLVGAEQVTALDQLETEHDNLRAVFRWAGEIDDYAHGLKLAESLWSFWRIRGHLTEGRGWFEKFLALATNDSAAELKETRSKALQGLGALLRALGELDQARQVYEQALALSREIGESKGIAASLNSLGTAVQEQGDHRQALFFFEESLALRRTLVDNPSTQRGIAVVLNNIGGSWHCQGDFARARAAFDECLAAFRVLGDKHGIAIVLNNLGEAARDQGDYERSLNCHEESLALNHELGNKEGVAFSLTNIGEVAGLQGDFARAEKLTAEALALFRELGHKAGIAVALNAQGEIAQLHGDFAHALALYRASLGLCQEVGDKRTMVSCWEGLARVACAHNQPSHAARLLGAATQIRESSKMPLPPTDRAYQQETVACMHAQLNDVTFAAEFAQGRAMTLEQATEYALKELT